MARLVQAEYDADPTLRRAVLEARLQRPKCRAQCVDGERPCPWLSCKYHLAHDVSRVGGLKENFPGRELDELPAGGCSLDLADRGGLTLEEVAAALNVVRERCRQIEERVLEKLRAALDAVPPRE